jgi:PAS domain S-box-containing protein
MQGEAEFSGSRWMRYCVRPFSIAATFVYVTFLCTLVLQSLFPYPFLFLFLGAAMGSAWFGGAIAGAVAVALSTLIIAFFFVPPYYSFAVSAAAGPYFISFIGCAVVVGAVSALRRHAESRIREARDLLEQRVYERTAELEHSNRELKESERNLLELTEAIPQQIWRAQPDGSVNYCNSPLLRFAGRNQEEMCGGRFLEVFHPDDLAHYQESWSAALRSRAGLEGEWRIRGGDGRYRWFLIRANPRLTTDGAVNCWYGTHIDLDDWKRTELALIDSRAQLAHVNRVMSMGEVTASVAHEINQPLAAIVANGYACLAWLKARNLAKVEASAAKIVEDGTRAGAIVTRLRALFLRQGENRASESINSIVRETMRILRDESIRRQISLIAELADSLPLVRVDCVQIQQALLNLAINGMDAMDETPRDRAILTFQSSVDSSGDVLIAVTDSGKGIPPDIAGRIYDPFFTTKPSGLGIGLSISRTIIEAHDGRLWVTQRPDGGSILRFTIPRESHEK